MHAPLPTRPLHAAAPANEAMASPAVVAAYRAVAATRSLQEGLDSCAREAAHLAGYDAALLSLSTDAGAQVGSYGLTPSERERFLRSRASASSAERQANRLRIAARCFPGTPVAYLPHATEEWNVVPSPQSRVGDTGRPGWHPDDTVFILVHDAAGRDVGVLSLDAPRDGLAPREGALHHLLQAGALVDLAADLLQARAAASDRDALAEQLRQAQRVEQIGRVTSEVAHDLNNVLTAVCGLADLAAEQAISDDMRRLLVGIEQAGRRGSELSRRLLDLVRNRTTSPCEPAQVNLAVCLRGCSPMLEQLLGAERPLLVHTSAECLQVRAPELHIVQVLLNLVVNARDAMPDGGRLQVHLEPMEEHGVRFACIAVRDEGVGMSPEVLARVTEPFFTTRSTGTGLGLATVQRIVVDLGGRLRIESAPGQGTTVRVELPRS